MRSAFKTVLSQNFSFLQAPSTLVMESSEPEDSKALVHIVVDDPSPFHPAFCSEEADMILASSEKNRIYFRLHSFTLRTTSGWFRSMLSLPQRIQHNPTRDILYLDEDAVTLEHLFRMISGLPILPIDSYDLIDSMLYAAEKYDMPGPPSILRSLAMSPVFLDQPFRLYATACRYGWELEAKYASERTLVFNLHAPEHKESLKKLSTNALLDLLELHRSRRDALRQRLNDPPFVPGGVATCVSCDELIDYHTWRELKYKIILEMDVRPLGDTILEVGLTQWPESRACWRAKCPNTTCDRVLYDKGETTRVIRECIENLPKSI